MLLTVLCVTAVYASTACAHLTGLSSVLPLKFGKAHLTRSDSEPSLSKRQNSITVTSDPKLYGGIYGYTCTVSIGTPPQSLTVTLDLNSGSVGVLGSPLCNQAYTLCNATMFDFNASSTAVQDTSLGTVEYNYSTTAFQEQFNETDDFFFFRDTMSLGSATLENVFVAELYREVTTTNTSFNGTTTYVTSGSLGLGFDNSWDFYLNQSQSYPSFLDVMVSKGIINAHAYSMYLDDQAISTGTILLGGYDSAKFSGPLGALPIQPDAVALNISTMTVALSSITVNTANGSTVATSNSSDVVFPLPARLDTFNPDIVLPSAIFDSVAIALTGRSDYFGEITVDCSLATQQISLELQFGGENGPIINIPASELVLRLYDPFDGETVPDCRLGIGNAGWYAESGSAVPDTMTILGEAFLRSAYIVFDLSNKLLYMAQAQFNVTESDIHEIEKDGIPGVVTYTESAVYPGASSTTTSMTSATIVAGSTSSLILTAAGSTSTLTSSTPSNSLSTTGAGSTTTNVESSSAVSSPTPNASAAASTAGGISYRFNARPGLSMVEVIIISTTVVLVISGAFLL